MKISLRNVGDIPAYKKVFGYVLNYKRISPSRAFIEQHNQVMANSKQSKFSKFVQKYLGKIFPECDVYTKDQFRNIYKGFIDKDVLDKYI